MSSKVIFTQREIILSKDCFKAEVVNQIFNIGWNREITLVQPHLDGGARLQLRSASVNSEVAAAVHHAHQIEQAVVVAVIP